MEQMHEAIETFAHGYKAPDGHIYGWVVGLKEVIGTGECYAWVQKARRNKSGGWQDFGVCQRSKKFTSVALANTWAFAEAAKRANRGSKQ